MFPLDFFVETENKEYGGEEYRSHHQAQEDGRRGIEALVDLCRPDERHAPEYHGYDAGDMNNEPLVFHAAKVQNKVFRPMIGK